MIELFIAIGAGLLSFLSPCVLPLIPGYISYISGSSLQELVEKKNINILPVILFTFGFSIIFIAFGAASTFFGQVLLQNSYELRVGAGLVISRPYRFVAQPCSSANKLSGLFIKISFAQLTIMVSVTFS